MTDQPDDRLAQILCGAADAIVGIGVVLANAGIVTREQLAEAMAEVKRQQAARYGEDAYRAYIPEMVRQFFALPLVGTRNFGVIDGGNDDPPPPRAA